MSGHIPISNAELRCRGVGTVFINKKQSYCLVNSSYPLNFEQMPIFGAKVPDWTFRSTNHFWWFSNGWDPVFYASHHGFRLQSFSIFFTSASQLPILFILPCFFFPPTAELPIFFGKRPLVSMETGRSGHHRSWLLNESSNGSSSNGSSSDGSSSDAHDVEGFFFGDWLAGRGEDDGTYILSYFIYIFLSNPQNLSENIQQSFPGYLFFRGLSTLFVFFSMFFAACLAPHDRTMKHLKFGTIRQGARRQGTRRQRWGSLWPRQAMELISKLGASESTKLMVYDHLPCEHGCFEDPILKSTSHPLVNCLKLELRTLPRNTLPYFCWWLNLNHLQM